MNLSSGSAILCVLLIALLSETTYGRPNELHLRSRRISDQRLAELETLLALQKVKGVVVPVGLGKVDPAIIGRRRRSLSDGIAQDKLQTVLGLLRVARDAESIPEHSEQIRSLPWKEDTREEQWEYYQLI
ncbi:uncharacterized protein LOC109858488 [Pseudomyrmex gracilis]|uniref:uncharacterized protein LOC109858488 n=1 Tax=Pseudomyrmex gracilis TaxID=219809 RepID=UPI000995B12F|nr:uncharacterized protein LOC109858488 [Pseudomyrmex gracilis]